MKALEKKTKNFEEEQLLTDEYISSTEKIENTHWKDNGDIEINKKNKEVTRQYEALHQKYFGEKSGNFRFIEKKSIFSE